MFKTFLLSILFISLFACGPAKKVPGNGSDAQNKIQDKIDAAVRPVMQEYNVPGMAIAVSIDGKRYFYNYGVASRETLQPVSSQTIFEIGSISKTLTATLAAYAQVTGKLSLADSTSKYFPELRGSSFDKISVLNLGTHTTGGLPLQVPDEVTDTQQLMAYFKNWHPKYEAGTYRSYSNPGTGLFGMVAARSLNQPFEEAMEKNLLPALGMTQSYIHVPAEQMKHYAYGYSKKEEPIRVNPGVLASEAYGIKSTATDLIRFVEANMQVVKLNNELKRAIVDTHTGYFAIGGMTQDLMWEQYPYPVTLSQLLAGNSAKVIFEHNPAQKQIPPLKPGTQVLINKTGSTNGFGGYVAYVPAKKIGVVILANKNYPIDARVTIAHQILKLLDDLGAL